MPEKSPLIVKETSRLLKFNEGKDPEKDEPDEIIEETRTLSQEEVQGHIDAGRLEITPEGTAKWVPEKFIEKGVD